MAQTTLESQIVHEVGDLYKVGDHLLTGDQFVKLQMLNSHFVYVVIRAPDDDD